jgi:hypothetical protein
MNKHPEFSVFTIFHGDSFKVCKRHDRRFIKYATAMPPRGPKSWATACMAGEKKSTIGQVMTEGRPGMLIIGIILEAIGGTLAMTAFVYLISLIVHTELRVVRVLGTMLTGGSGPNKGVSNSSGALLAGGILHYSVGVLFSLVYHILWHYRIGRPDIAECCLLGGVSGVIAIFAWNGYLNIHRKPPAIDKRYYLPIIGVGHLFFGVGLFLTRAWFGG